MIRGFDLYPRTRCCSRCCLSSPTRLRAFGPLGSLHRQFQGSRLTSPPTSARAPSHCSPKCSQLRDSHEEPPQTAKEIMHSECANADHCHHREDSLGKSSRGAAKTADEQRSPSLFCRSTIMMMTVDRSLQFKRSSFLLVALACSDFSAFCSHRWQRS